MFEEIKKELVRREAVEYSRRRNKPLLNVGAKLRKWGDVNCDINPVSGVDFCDVHDLSQYGDKEFGAVLASHVLEHITDPDKALRELNRVADKVFILTPHPLNPMAWLYPPHKWVFINSMKLKLPIRHSLGDKISLGICQ